MTKDMELNIDDIESSAHQNMLDYVRNEQTRKKYDSDLKRFLELVPGTYYEKYNIDSSDKTEAFVTLTKQDVKVSKKIINAYVRELKKKIENDEISVSRVLNLIKPIKALFAANDVDFSWKLINKGIPKNGKSPDKAYTREQLQILLESASNIIDKVALTLSSSAGFRVEAWDYFNWEDVVMFYNEDNTIKGGALRVYRGSDEEYWTHFTPEAGKYLQLYRESWKSKFGRYPKDDDPLIASIRFHDVTRLKASGIWTRLDNLSRRVGIRIPLQEGQKRHKIMLAHGLRKYCNTMLRRAKVDFADKEDLQGRNVGGQENSYERYEEGDFERFEEYQKAIPLLTISDVERKELKIKELQKEKNEITKLKQKLEDSIQDQQKTNAEMMRFMSTMAQKDNEKTHDEWKEHSKKKSKKR